MTDSFTFRNAFAWLAEDPPKPAMDNYDSNDARDLKTEHVLRLTFQALDALITIEVIAPGNVQGFANLDTAIYNFYEALPENERGDPYLVLRRPNGDTLLIDERSGADYGPLDEETRGIISSGSCLP